LQESQRAHLSTEGEDVGALVDGILGAVPGVHANYMQRNELGRVALLKVCK
jgi:hypothetical protein